MHTQNITADILKQLHNPKVYPFPTESVKLIQTHISWLFLTDTHVFKIKKPVSFGFLDFSTQELRRYYCNEELRLNRRLCPDMYIKVIALRKTSNGVSFIGKGSIIDHAVMMMRLPSDGMLDVLVDNDNISSDAVVLIANRISKFHSEAATSPQISTFGTTDKINFNWQENFKQTEKLDNSILPQQLRYNIKSYIEAFISSHHALFAERITNGYIRECDGDIHLGNICLTKSTAYIFDCIEFNERFRYSDTAADLAFLLMDFDYHGRSDLADLAQASYIKASGDEKLAELATFYKVYRAFVRGKVESLQLLDSDISAEDHIKAKSRAIKYFRLAQGYCLRSHLSPTLFITCGTMGCGKSTIAALLAFELGIRTISSDAIRKQLNGITPETPVRVPFGENIYSDEMTRTTYEFLEELAEKELLSGHSVIIDASFASARQRSDFARLAVSCNASFVILFVQLGEQEQSLRLQGRVRNGVSTSDGRLELLKQQKELFEQPYEAEGVVIVCNTEIAPENSIDAIYERIFRL